MDKTGVLAVLVVLVSVVLFMVSDVRQSGVTGVRLYEGPQVQGGREGFVEAEFFNPDAAPVSCTVRIAVNAVPLDIPHSFGPGRTLANFSVVLPDGENEVTLNADC